MTYSIDGWEHEKKRQNLYDPTLDNGTKYSWQESSINGVVNSYTDPDFVVNIMMNEYWGISPSVYMMIGLPCSGKSTFLEKKFFSSGKKRTERFFHYSTDEELE